MTPFRRCWSCGSDAECYATCRCAKCVDRLLPGRAMRILAIDPGSTLGWATNSSGPLTWGEADFHHWKDKETPGSRWRRFSTWLQCMPPLDLIVFEKVTFTPRFRRANQHVVPCFTSRIEEWCETAGIGVMAVAVPTLKAYAIPKQKRIMGDDPLDRSKDAMIRTARVRLVSPKLRAIGITTPTPPLTEHEADALWLFWYGMEKFTSHKEA